MTELSSSVDLETTLAADDGYALDDEFSDPIGRGSEIGRYVVLSEVGTGAMGVVYGAYDPQLDRRVAIKLLKRRDSDVDLSRERLQREAQALAKLDHPNVVSVHDVGLHDDQLFIAMEFVDGQTLGQWLATAPQASTGSRVPRGSGRRVPLRPWREVLDVFVQAGRGLAAAHDAGLVHRDFKPDNVMLSDGGRVRVMDFGVARTEGTTRLDTTKADAPVDSLTQTGTLLGTPAYMALEQFTGEPIDARCDQFSLCVALHEALYGTRPFGGETLGELVLALEQGRLEEPPGGAQVPGWVRAVVLRGLATRPEDRFASMHALLDALTADPAVRRRKLVGGVGLAGLLAASAWGVLTLAEEVEQRDEVIEEQATELERTNTMLEAQLATQRGLRASALVGMGHEGEALVLGVQAVGAYRGAWDRAPRDAVTGLEQVLAHDARVIEPTFTLRDHEHYVSEVAYSPDGTRLGTTSTDGRVRLWDPASGRLLTTMVGHRGAVDRIAFSPDGTRLATTSADHDVRLWDAESGESLATLVGHDGEVRPLAFSPDGTRLATGADHDARLWDAQTGALVFTLGRAEDHRITDVGFTPDGARLVTTSTDATARIWNTTTGENLATLQGHQGPVYSLEISPDGAQVATAGHDELTRLWALPTGQPLATLGGHTARITEIAYSRDGSRVATASWDKTARVYDPTSGSLVAALVGGHRYGIPVLVFSPDGARLITGSYEGRGVVWDPETGQIQAQLRGHRADLWGVEFSPSGQQIATASADRTAMLWDLQPRRVTVIAGPETDAVHITYAPDHTRIATVSEDGRLRLWKSDTGELLHTLHRFESSEGVSLIYAPDGSQLVTHAHGTVQVWDPATGAPRISAQLKTTTHKYIRYAVSGAYIYLWDERGAALYDPTSLALLASFDASQRPAYAPGGSHVAVLTASSKIQVLDIKTKAVLAESETSFEAPVRLAYSPDGTQLVAHTGSGVLLLDSSRLALRASLPDTSKVKLVTQSPDGSRLVLTKNFGGMEVWHAQTHQRLLSFDDRDDDVRLARPWFSPRGDRLLFTGNGFLRTYDTETGQLLSHIDRMYTGVPVIWPDGKRVTLRGLDRGFEVWNIETGERLTKERVALVGDDGSVTWPIPPRTLTQLGCARLRPLDRHYAQVRDLCDPLLDDVNRPVRERP